MVFSDFGQLYGLASDFFSSKIRKGWERGKRTEFQISEKIQQEKRKTIVSNCQSTDYTRPAKYFRYV
jgi:hypothetical protein